MENKKGQVTLFVILGIVIVAVIVLLIAFRRDIYLRQEPRKTLTQQ